MTLAKFLKSLGVALCLAGLLYIGVPFLITYPFVSLYSLIMTVLSVGVAYKDRGLHRAAASRHQSIVKVILTILPAAWCNPKDNHGYTPLHYAARAGRLDVVEAIWTKLPEGADCNPKADNGETPLVLAAQDGRLHIVEAIWAKLPAGADCNPKNNYGDTPLHLAAFYEQLNVVKAILAKLSAAGAECNPKDNNGYTPLLVAAQCGDHSVVDYLLTQPNIIVNCPNNDGEAPLHFFNQGENAALRERLRQRGALEWRPPEVRAAGLVVANNSQSVHDALTERSVSDSIEALSKGKTTQQINDAFENFKKYIGCADFETDITEISKTPFGEGAIGVYTKAVTTTPKKRRELLMKAIRGERGGSGYVERMMDAIRGERGGSGYVERMMDAANSPATREKFQKVAGLVWLAIHDKEHLEAIKSLGEGAAESQVKSELKEVRHNLFKRILSIQYEYLGLGQSVETSHPACGPGTVNHHLAILNGVHDQVRVSNQPITQSFDSRSRLKEQLLAQGYQRLMTVITDAFKEKKEVLNSIVEDLSVGGCTAETYGSFLCNTDEAPRTLETQLALEKFIGAIKAQFTPQRETDYLELEDALREVPFVEELMPKLMALDRELNPGDYVSQASSSAATGSQGFNPETVLRPASPGVTPGYSAAGVIRASEMSAQPEGRSMNEASSARVSGL